MYKQIMGKILKFIFLLLLKKAEVYIIKKFIVSTQYIVYVMFYFMQLLLENYFSFFSFSF